MVPRRHATEAKEEVASATIEDVRPAEEQQCREAEEARGMVYGMDAIMAGTAYFSGDEQAEEAMVLPPRRHAEDIDEQTQRQRKSRTNTDMLARLRVSPERSRKHAFELRQEGAARLAASQLRRRVTLPSDVEEQDDLQAKLDTAERLPRVSCAFRGCSGPQKADEEEAAKSKAESESFWDRTLRCHILRKHKEEIQNIALVDEEYIWDTYKEALAVQEWQSVPAVGAAVDRRTFDITLELYNDDKIQALICFCCARV